MGCGASKCDSPSSDSLPAKIRPLLLRRLGEMRRRSRNVVSSNSSVADLSKKELLKDAVICDDDVSAHPLFDQSLHEKKEANDDVVNVDTDDDDDVVEKADKEAQHDSQPDSLPAKTRPLLLRRFGEMRRRSRNVVSSNSSASDLSKKELLKEAVVYDDDDVSAHPISDQSLEKNKKEANDDFVNVHIDDDVGEKAEKEAQRDSTCDSLPAKIRPLLLQRFGEMRRKSRNAVSSNSSVSDLSKKELLKEAVICDYDVSAHPISNQSLEKIKKEANGDVVNVDIDDGDDDEKAAKEAQRDSHSDYLPPRIRPLLFRRFGEMRRRSRNAVSKKKLLKEAVICDDDISAHPIYDQSLGKNEANDDVVNVDNDEDEEEKAEKETQSLVGSPRVVLEPETEAEKMLKQRSKQDMHLKIETSVIGTRFINDGFYPGSPSFRVYFIESLTDKDDDDNHSDKEDDSDKKSQADQSSSADVDSINSDSATKTKKKKSRRVHRFRNVIPKGRRRSVKNLLNVRSCYNPSCGSQQDDAILLRQKTPHSL